MKKYLVKSLLYENKNALKNVLNPLWTPLVKETIGQGDVRDVILKGLILTQTSTRIFWVANYVNHLKQIPRTQMDGQINK